jgi:hypothetical protein
VDGIRRLGHRPQDCFSSMSNKTRVLSGESFSKYHVRSISGVSPGRQDHDVTFGIDARRSRRMMKRSGKLSRAFSSRSRGFERRVILFGTAAEERSTAGPHQPALARTNRPRSTPTRPSGLCPMTGCSSSLQPRLQGPATDHRRRRRFRAMRGKYYLAVASFDDGKAH